ncbi:MAG: DegT/DnrJ/EryC1/StrS aminotransferase family protein [Deltaproteobacteria bacterium]|nr:DegT/DnrJ/EryC1/StrS aminotransferase family protein [Deltaproteobacteria bacterium]MBW1737653.1 DegT/DnrJ/EryC1/StrS aminotransferase family protein [Deltaproteobacteria bacterium]MBW1908185.1 DegT/DnrJ/EryC1/StrS aminotransferase family protein [Deltaproteobacteria bacterium]MBW2032866.1 DegT/DnrJ/EryC1/StrS aminotransferase family protein [Deltaproteobacteria bacterium]MBW2114694.1 DegT/DnrJ/EryC1/StrS aminotransferase family protein [Deltaproteobacteria bacterium]
MKSAKHHTSIPHSRPTLGHEEIQFVSEVIGSGHIAQGAIVSRFEQALAKNAGIKGAVACSSGTSALHLTLLAMEIRSGDEVIFPSYVCSALLNAVRYVGATPVLAEINPYTWNIDPEDVKKRLTHRTKAIIVPHLFGLAADLNQLISLGVPVIEDCAQAVGATCDGKNVGSLGFAAIFSFYATKVITTGEGGMVLSNSQDLLNRIRDLREYDQKSTLRVRYNYKMTDIQASMGLAQLDRLQSFIRKRRSIAQQYYKGFDSLPFQLPLRDDGHIYYRYVIILEEDSGPQILALAKKGIECARPVYMPLHRYLKTRGYRRTEQIWKKSLSIPIYPSLTDDDVNRIIDSVVEVLGELIS